MKRKWRIMASSQAKKTFGTLSTRHKTMIREKLRKVCDKDCPAQASKPIRQLAGYYEIKVDVYRVIYFPTKNGIEIGYLGTLNIADIIHRKDLKTSLQRL